MLINADAKGLEWRAVLHQSGDKVGIQEILDGRDIHAENKKEFDLPERVIAKTFLFRAIFKGSAYAYSVDPNFAPIGGQDFWQRRIDSFYNKYTGIFDYHERLLSEAKDTGKVVVPSTGRIYEFEPKLRKGETKWPETDIVNYPVQGWSADVMALVRVHLYGQLREKGLIAPFVLLNNTVHDSIVADVDNARKYWYNTVWEINNSFKEASKNYELLFNDKLLLPMECEIQVGNNWSWMHEIKLN